MKKVLIVDDEKEIRSIFAEVFRQDLEFESVTFAQNGVEATNECLLQEFDVITLDHMMPKLKGADFLAALRNKPGINQNTPVIMISADPDIAIGVKSHKNTFFIDKPVDFNRLLKYVKMSLQLT